MYDFHNYFLTPQQDMVVNLVLFAILIIAVMKGTGKISGAGPVVTLLLIASFCVVGRVLLQPIPNVQPVTVTLILVGIYYGSPWAIALSGCCLLYTSPSPRDKRQSRMPSSA